MASKYDGLARIIIQNVGGKDNINSVAHCVTRLRFKLKDEGKANDEVLEQTDGVLQIMHAGGQYQVVIGPHVTDVYEAVLQVGHLTGGGEVDLDGNPVEGGADDRPKGALNFIMDLVSGIVQPTLGLLAAAGTLKGLLSLLGFFGVMTSTDGSYMVINAVADGFFYFLPIMLGYTSAKKFGCNEFVGLAMGAALVYPAMVNSTAGEALGSVLGGTPFEMSYYHTFFGIPIIMPASGYTSSVVPIIVSMFFVAKIEKFFKKIVSSLVAFFMVPMLTILVGVVLTYLLIGPIASMLTSLVLLLFNVVTALPVVGGTLAGVVVGGLWQVLVIFGLHWALVPLSIANIGANGMDTVLVGKVACEMGQIAVVLAIYLKTRDKKVRAIALPSIVTGLFGTTEPAIYGVTLPRMKPFVFSCIAGAISGGVATFFGAKIFVSGYSGILALARYIDPNPGGMGIMSAVYAGIAMVVAVVIGFLLTWFFWDEKGWEARKGAKKRAA